MKGYLYLMPALIIILLFTAYPLVRAFLMSFYEDYNMISGEYSRIGLGNYKDLLVIRILQRRSETQVSMLCSLFLVQSHCRFLLQYF